MPDTSPLESEAYRKAPHEVLARLREEDPIHFMPSMGAWVALRYDDVRRLFTDPHVTNDQRAFALYQAPPEGTYRRWLSENSLFSAPPDQHARQRKLVSAALTPRAVARQEKQVRDVVEQFAEPLRGRTGVVDLVGEYTAPIPSTVIGRITGIPPKGDDEARFRQLAREVLSGISPVLDEAARKVAESAMLEMTDYVREMAVERREHPQEDLVTDLVQAWDEGESMSNEEIVLMVVALVVAGTETTALASTRGLWALMDHPDQLEMLRADRTLLPNAVDELLRYDAGIGFLPRYALEDFELRGKRIAKGQPILLSFLSAHRDPEVFPDPDRLDVERDTRDLTVFGHGPHYCLGANLARQELRCIYDAALDFLPPGAHVLPDQIEWMSQGPFTRAETLPVAF